MQDFGIALAAPERLSEESLRLVALMNSRNFALTFRLEGVHIPHITLYQGRFAARKRAKEAWKQLLMLYKDMIPPQLELCMEEQLIVRPSGNVFWCAEKSNALAELHMLVAREMQVFTDRLLVP